MSPQDQMGQERNTGMLFLAQGEHGIELGRAERRDATREQRRGEQQ
jgi:hypothetical protein